jgi:hypothetical protein
MFTHRPSCSQGPLSRTRAWWFRSKGPGAKCDRRRAGGSSCSPVSHDCEIRTDLVERVRRALAEGRYETPEKWEAALEALYQRLQDI